MNPTKHFIICYDKELLFAHYKNRGEIYFWRKSPPFSSGEWRKFQGHINALERDDVHYAIDYPIKFSTMAVKYNCITRFNKMILALAEYSESSEKENAVSCHSLLHIDPQFGNEWNDMIKEWTKLTSGGMNGLDDVLTLVNIEIQAEIRQKHISAIIEKVNAYANTCLNKDDEPLRNVYYDTGTVSIPFYVVEAMIEKILQGNTNE